MPLAAVLWRGGISFGGVVSFIFADLIVLPILDIYRKYYGGRVLNVVFLVLAAAMLWRFVRTGGRAMLGMMG